MLVDRSAGTRARESVSADVASGMRAVRLGSPGGLAGVRWCRGTGRRLLVFVDRNTVTQPCYRSTCQVCSKQIRGPGICRASNHSEQNRGLVDKSSLGRPEDSLVPCIFRSLQVVARLLYDRLRNKETDERDQDRKSNRNKHRPNHRDLGERRTCAECRDDLDHDQANHVVHHRRARQHDSQSTLGETARGKNGESGSQRRRTQRCSCGEGLHGRQR